LRDFKARDINGDVVINDNSTEHKLLIHCSIEELVHEEKHRNEILGKERKRKNTVVYKFLGLSALLLLLAAGWFYIEGQMNLVSFLLGGAGVLMGYGTLQQAEKSTDFEQRQIATLNEIHMILRERGSR